ncbi:MAG TPA: AbrB/MazE/SpoVT family DNA-binding domain-containing protein [Ignavibacteria bacterium]|nr:AbrB/MazE/SpoVT family DNA-binding domain-containing protein [Ignavibacteria bacterium]
MIKIPKSILKECGFGEMAELLVKNNSFILSPVKEARKGWAEQFALQTKNKKQIGDDLKDFREFVTDWDKNEW